MVEISVLMSVYNGEKYLAQSIESILGQTFEDFEFVIIDDGSTDGSIAILAEYAQRDHRIILVTNTENLGITPSITRGLQYCNGRFIARMDQDDISEPDRFQMQHDFLLAHPEIDALGAGFDFIDRREKFLSTFPTRPDDPMILRHQMFYHCVLHNPTVMMKTEFYKQYNEDHQEEAYYGADDYHYWLRMNFDHLYSNLPDRLLLYRLHKIQVSMQDSGPQRDSILRSALEAFERLLSRSIPIEVVHTLYFPNRYESTDPGTILEAYRVVYQVQRRFEKTNVLNREQLSATRDFSYDKLKSLLAKYQKYPQLLLPGLIYLFRLYPGKFFNGMIQKTGRLFSLQRK